MTSIQASIRFILLAIACVGSSAKSMRHARDSRQHSLQAESVNLGEAAFLAGMNKAFKCHAPDVIDQYAIDKYGKAPKFAGCCSTDPEDGYRKLGLKGCGPEYEGYDACPVCGLCGEDYCYCAEKKGKQNLQDEECKLTADCKGEGRGCACEPGFCWCVSIHGVGTKTCVGDTGDKLDSECEPDLCYDKADCPGGGYECAATRHFPLHPSL